jgi:hypothetical protein
MQQETALGRRTTVTAEHLLAAQVLEDKLASSCSRSQSRTPPSSPARPPTSSTPITSGISDRAVPLACVMQFLQREQAADERDALREAQHAAQLAALRGSPPAHGHPSSFTPNKGFNEIKRFAWTRRQDLLPWLQDSAPGPTFCRPPLLISSGSCA